jgi:hypothetical protein
VRWVSRVVEDVHLIAYRIFRFAVKTKMPEGENSGAKLLPSRLEVTHGIIDKNVDLEALAS